jgi:hypothetical protein
MGKQYYRSILYKVGKKIHPLFNKLENKPYAKLYHYIGSSNNNTNNTNNNDNTDNNTNSDNTNNIEPTYYNPYDFGQTDVGNDSNSSGQVSTPNDESQYKIVMLPVVHSIEMEQVKKGDEIITEKHEVFIFQKSDLMKNGIYNISLNDLVEFPYYPEPPDDWNYNPQLYRVTGVQDILSLIKVFTKKASV